jgi:hypothetical protein
MKNLIRKILKEDIIHDYDDNYHYKQISSWLKPPYFKNMEGLGLTPEEKVEVLSEVFGERVEYNSYMRSQDVRLMWDKCSNYPLYEEKYYNGEWKKYEYDEYCRKLYEERSDGYSETWIYDKGRIIFHSNSTGYWEEYERNKNGDLLYWEDSNGNWEKNKYDKDGNNIYEETKNDSVTTIRKFDKNGCVISKEWDNGKKWTKYKIDKVFWCKVIYEERHTGYWIKRKFNKNGKLVYSETSRGKIIDKR